MDVAALSDDQLRALAASPQTDPGTLAMLAKNWTLCSAVAENPATPAELREQIYRDWRHLRPPVERGESDGGGEVDRVIAADRAIAAFRARSATAARTADARWSATGSARTAAYAAASRPATNGFAIASLVTSLVGFSLFGVIFGHIANGQIARTGEGGTGMATAGLVIGYATMIFGVLLLLSN